MRGFSHRLLAALLCCLMLLSCCSAAFAAVAPRADGSQIPIILIGGDGTALEDANGNEVFRFINLSGKDPDPDTLKESILNVVKPLLVQGLLTNNFQPYYDALYAEVAEMFKDVILDENGEPQNGVGMKREFKDRMADSLRRDARHDKGYYAQHDYEFWYDWRLDPMATADLLKDHIEGVKAVTGAQKVILQAHCVGSAVVFAYIAKYGSDSIYGLGLDGITGGGSEPLSESISGKFHVDGAAVNRLLYDLEALDYIHIDSFINETVDLAVRSGMLDSAKNSLKLMLYYRIVEGATSALALSTFYSCPMYWSAVRPQDFDDALQYVFGPEGSEKREKYAGLIEKVQAYHDQVAVRIPELLLATKENGANMCVIAKYGWQIIPTGENCDVVGDQIASLNCAALGATGSKVYGVLDDAYIAKQVAAGKGKYISPDLQVDASTCLFPDYTWFIKGARHSNWTMLEEEILCTVLSADHQLTVDDLTAPQYIVVDNDTGAWEPMTSENSNTYHWDASADPSVKQTFLQRVQAFFRSLRTWFESLRRILRERRQTSETEG